MNFGMDLRDEFENSFLRFVEALTALTHDAVMQCEQAENYNAPWEIKDNVYSQGLASLRMSAAYLSWEQAEKILDLLASLRRLPKEAISVPHMKMTHHVGCITAMNHPAWEPLRKEAEALLALLEPAVERNQAYFKNQ
jgi:hypothetical protein